MRIQRFAVTFSFYLTLTFSAQAQLDFKDPVFPDDQQPPDKLAVADFDGNGIKDIAYTSQPDGVVHVLYNQGAYKYIEYSIKISTEETTDYFMQTGDFNKDGLADLVVMDQPNFIQTNFVVLLISKGTEFTLKRLELPVVFSKRSIDVADLDGDGNIDILFGSPLSPVIQFKGDGTGNFNSVTTDISIGGRLMKIVDFNKDGQQDVIVASENILNVYIRSQTGGYEKITASASGNPLAMTTADFSGDGYPDLAITIQNTTTGATQLNYFVNDKNNHFGTAQIISTIYPPLFGLESVDYDKDGRIDMVAGSWSQGHALMIIHNQGSDVFSSESVANYNSKTPIDIKFSDLQNDGVMEIVELGLGKTLNIYSYTNNQFTLVKRRILGIQAITGTIADINSDGKNDIVSLSPTNASIALHLGEGDFKFRTPQYLQFDGEINALETGDFNSDGSLDLIYCSTFESIGTFIMYSDKMGGFNAPTLIDFTSGHPITVADFNSDTKLDYANPYGVYVNDGLGHFVQHSFSQTPIANIESGFFNTDNHIDLAVNNGTETFIGFNDGAGNFTSFTKINSPNTFNRIKPVYFDSDNLTDLISLSGNSAIVLRNNANGTFMEKKISIQDGILYGAVNMADMNLDGRADIVAGVSLNSGFLGVAVFVQNESGEFNLSKTVSTTQGKYYTGLPDDLLISDVNQDSKNDIVIYKLNGAPLVVIPNDFLKEPTAQASVTVTKISSEEMSITFKKGNGSGRLLSIREASFLKSQPSDGVFYAFNTKFGIGTDLGSSNFILSGGNENELSITGLKPGTKYVLEVFEFSVNSKNTLIDYLTTSTTPLEVTTKKNQTIAPVTITSKIMGGPDFEVVATSDSGLPVSLAVESGGVEIKGTTVSIKNAGPVKILATQDGNDAYLKASLEISFCVNPSIPVITVSTTSPGSFLLTSSSDVNNQWLLEGNVIAGAINKTYSPVDNGTYSVKVDYSGCSNISLPTSNLITGLERYAHELLVYPNPVIDFLSIKWPDANSPVQGIILSDALGRKSPIYFKRESESLSLDLRSASAGMYSLIIQTDNKAIVQKILKQD